MYHILALFLVLNIVNNGNGIQEYRRRNRYRPEHYLPDENNNVQKIFNYNELLRQYFKADDTFERFCFGYSTVQPSITYGNEECVIKYAVPLTAEFNIDVKITNKILKTSVLMDTEDPNFSSFTDVRVLPDILDFNEAVWSIMYGQLNVTIPYKVPLGTEFTARCDTVDNKLIDVPISQKNKPPKFQYKMSDWL